METNGNESAHTLQGVSHKSIGLTKREEFAKHFMAALMVGTTTQINDTDLAERATEAADCLIKEINKTKP